MGVSNGATIATWLATQPIAVDAAALVLISPNFGPADARSRLLLLPWGGHLAELLIGAERHWEPQNALHGRYSPDRGQIYIPIPFREEPHHATHRRAIP